MNPISLALQNPQSKLRVFRFGSFTASPIQFENAFKLTFSNTASLCVGSITVGAKNPSGTEVIYNKIEVGNHDVEKPVHAFSFHSEVLSPH